MAKLEFIGHSERVDVYGPVEDLRRVARTLLEAEGVGAVARLVMNEGTERAYIAANYIREMDGFSGDPLPERHHVPSKLP